MSTPVAAIIYISISGLLVISAGMFLVKTIQFLIKKKQPANHHRGEQVMFLRPDPNTPLSISTQRAKIIVMLERQFASSPSSDS